MKRRIGPVLALMLALYCASTALANSWGLTGELYGALEASDAWNDYTQTGGQAGNAAVMHSRYHNALMLTDGGKLTVLTRAVYQPDCGRDNEVGLKKTDDGFTLSYGEAEEYRFFTRNGEYVLMSARIGGFTVTATDDPVYAPTLVYTARDASGEARWMHGFRLANFNIGLFPRSVDEIRHINLMLAALDSGGNCLGEGVIFGKLGKGTEPVYSAPFGASAWRAAKGKAAVGLGGELLWLGGYQNADGEAYALIEYAVSERTSRIGYIRGGLLGMAYSETPDVNERYIHVPVRAVRETYLTDDPNTSQYPQFSVPVGTQFECMAIYGSDYAYVSAEVLDGKFVDGGAIVWGFVPIKALEPDPAFGYRAQVQRDVMDALAGSWEFFAGGDQAETILNFRKDGTYTGVYPLGDDLGDVTTRGTWTVTRYDPSWNLYWNDPPYELTLTDDDGTVNVKGLVLDDGGFGLTFWEGGGSYRRAGAEE